MKFLSTCGSALKGALKSVFSNGYATKSDVNRLYDNIFGNAPDGKPGLSGKIDRVVESTARMEGYIQGVAEGRDRDIENAIMKHEKECMTIRGSAEENNGGA